MGNSVKSNISFAVLSQVITILKNIFVSLALPKILPIDGFGYWQLFILYASFVGIFHFGITDGMYLRISKSKNEDVSPKQIKGQFRLLVLIDFFISLILIGILCLCNIQGDRFIVMIMIGVYLVFANIEWYLGHLFQAIEKGKTYSNAIIISTIFFIIAFLIFAILGMDNYRIYVLAYIVTTIINVAFLMFKAKFVMKEKTASIDETLDITKKDIKIGIFLTVANFSNLLILGMTKQAIDLFFGLTTFSKVSFSISLINFFLLFLSQVGLVILPFLNNQKEDDKKTSYQTISSFLSYFLMLAYVAYVPLAVFVKLWLPNYVESLKYLGVLLPICMYDGYMKILYSTYLNLLGKTRKLLYINCISIVIVTISAILGGVIFDSINIILIGTVISIIIQCIISEIYITKLLEIKKHKYFIINLVVTIIFLVISNIFNYWITFSIASFVYILYLILDRKMVISIIKMVVKKERKDSINIRS